MSASLSLPAGFERLEHFVGQWLADTTAERAQRRTDSTPEERQAFFDAAAPMLERAMAYLDARPLAELNDAEKRLLKLMCSLAHVQMAVEIHREMEPRHAMLREAMIITHSVTDII